MLLRRLVGGGVTLLLAVTLAFLLVRLAGDPVIHMLGDVAPPEQIEAKRQELGLDRPLIVQYLSYMGSLLTGDLGESLRYQQPNGRLIASRLAASLQLAGVAILLAVVIGVPIGVFAALREGTVVDRIMMFFALIGQSLPLFWLGMMLIFLFAVELGWLPAGQSGSWRHVILPAVALSAYPMARIARLTRSSAIDVMEEDYVTAARARGLSYWRVATVHVLRNAALPVVTVIGLHLGQMLSGVVTLEVVFSWPGLGALAVDALRFRDFFLVQAIVVVGASLFVTINLTVDLLYGVIDPRIRDTGI
jgi:peptide/nickel transport system permease protein